MCVPEMGNCDEGDVFQKGVCIIRCSEAFRDKSTLEFVPDTATKDAPRVSLLTD